MHSVFLFTLGFLLALIPLSTQGDEKPEPTVFTSKVYYLTTQDKPEYAAFVTDKTSWHKINIADGLPMQGNNAWVQMNFDVKASDRPQGLFISMLGSYEAYWDGLLIGKNGVVGDSLQSEKPGAIDNTMLIPQHLFTSGTHTLSLKISNYYNTSAETQTPFWCMIGDYDRFLMFSYKRASLPLIMSGALLLIALYCFIVYFFTIKEISYLLFSGLCIAILLLIVVESWRGLWGYTYDWQIPRLLIVLGLSVLISTLLMLFFTFFFRLNIIDRLKWLFLALISQLCVLIYFDGYDDRSLYIFLIGISISSMICIQVMYKRNWNALLMLSGLLLFIAPITIDKFSYMDQYFFISFSALIFLILYTLTQTMKNRQQQLAQSQINAGRLELELVKRNLQPHFILNTLTAIEEWIEDSPQDAVKFIQALAREFRYMARISSKPSIELADEVSLCHSHLKVMEFRSNIRFSLVTSDCDLSIVLPPGILLTLIENAISHNNYSDGEIIFILKQHIENNTCTLLFNAPITHRSSSKATNTGTGNKYIEARLKESFMNNWEMTTTLDNKYWSVNIKMPLFFQKTSNKI